MSRKRHNPKDVVGLDENLTPYELYQSKLMKNVIDSVFSERWGNKWDGYSFMFSGKDGELVEQHVKAIRRVVPDQ